jgi:hypothetical protein
MPYFYDTNMKYSEAELSFSPAQDWTRLGVTVLSISFLGDGGNSLDPMYVKINSKKVAYNGDAVDITRPRWNVWNIDLASLGVNLQNITSLIIGFGNDTNPTAGGSGVVYFDNIRLYRSAPAVVLSSSEEIWIEAEAADTIGASWRLYDDSTSSGGKHIGSENGDGSDGDTAPGAEWTATYNFNTAGGDYKILLRTIAPTTSDDSYWIRIPTATSQTHEDPDQPSTGWVRFNDIAPSEGWNWDEVHSNDHSDEIVNWTLPTGEHTLEIAKREDGTWLDTIVISKVD